MDMLFVANVLLVEVIDVNRFGIVGCAQKLDEISLEIFAVVRYYSLRSFRAYSLYLPDMAFALNMALEAILISILLFAYLTVPAQAL